MAFDRKALVRVWVVVAIIGIAALSLALLGPKLNSALHDLPTRNSPHRFSAVAWRTHPDERYWMALDLYSSDILRGKSETWLATTLGWPAVPHPVAETTGLDWDVSTPQHPGEQLMIGLDHGIVTTWTVTADPMNAPY